MNNDTTSRVTHACFTGAEFALDALITRNRDKARLRMANNEDILALHAFLTPGEVMGKLLDWHLVCLDLLNENTVTSMAFIVAIREETGKERMTTFIRGLDLDRGLVQTENSIYALGKRSAETLSQLRLDFIAAVLCSWGLGGYLGIK